MNQCQHRIALDDIERLYGDSVLAEVMSSRAHPELKAIFNKVLEAETAAWGGGLHSTRPKAFVDLSDARD